MAKAQVQTLKIVAVEKSVEDPGTGATVAVHVVKYYGVDLIGLKTSATLAGYVSAAALQAGRSPVTHTTVTAPGVPPVGEDPVQWIYAQLVAAPADGAENTLAGVVAVLEVEA